MEPETKNIASRKNLNSGTILAAAAIIGISALAFYTNESLIKLHNELSALQERNNALESKITDADARLNKFNEDTQEMRVDFFMRKLSGIVDFSTSNVQDIGNGFYLVKAEQEEHLTGIRFKGRVINAQSIDHDNVEFKLTVSGQTKEFTINRISSGNSTEFSLYIPEIKASDARYGKIEYESSSISYYVK